MAVILAVTGNVGKEPESRFTPSGAQVTNFSVASTRKYKTASGEQVKETTWFKVSTWGKLAEVCSQYVKKGMKVMVQGRFNVDLATGGPKTFTRADGSTSASFEIVASEVEFLSAGNGNGSEAPAEEPSEEEIPF